MFRKLMAPLFGSLILFIPFPVSGQAHPSNSPAGQPTAPGLLKLTGEDETRAKQLNEQIAKALKADRWDEAVARAEELLALRARAQGLKHFETVTAEWRVKTLCRVASMPKEDRAAYQSANAMSERGQAFHEQGKYARAQPLREKALEYRRRLLMILDSRTLQSTPESGARAGYDGAKRRKGSKVHAAVDTLGHLLALHVTPADGQDRAQAAN